MTEYRNDEGLGETDGAAGRAGEGGRRGAGPRKVNRRDPEKRREQNRAAQKVYRERQKQKLRDLESQLHHVQTKQQQAPLPQLASQAPTVIPLDLPEFPMSQQPCLEGIPVLDDGFDLSMPMFLPTPESASLPSPGPYSADTDILPFLQSSNSLFNTNPLFGTMYNGEDQFSLLRSNNSWVSATSASKIMPWRPTDSSSLGPRSRPTEAGEEDEVIEVERRPAKGPQWHGDTILHCSCLEYHEPKGRCMGKVQIFPDPMTARWREPTPEIEFPGHRLPDLHRNAIQVHQMCIVDAMLRNLVLLGVPAEVFCAEETESPFFSYGIEASDGAIAAVQMSFKTLKHDLRPSRLQVAKSHHPYIDVIPIPSVRKRLIELQHEIDEDAFYIDAVKGFRCWGGRRESKRDPSYGSGTPWDMRSWEATPDFLRKWRCVLGDEDGEVARHSRWWRVMRGEEEDDA